MNNFKVNSIYSLPIFGNVVSSANEDDDADECRLYMGALFWEEWAGCTPFIE